MAQPLTIEQQRAYLQQRIAGFEEMNAFVAEERRRQTEAERWRDSDELHLCRLDTWPTPAQPQRECGLIEQQRLFRKLAGR